MSWASRYIGLPFVDGGCDFNGVDCWRLVRLVFANECGIELPVYGEISAFDMAAIAEKIEHEANIDPWRKIQKSIVTAFDVAVMRRRHKPAHIGVMVNSDKLLHIEEKTAAVLVPLSHPALACRPVQFFRHKDLI